MYNVTYSSVVNEKSINSHLSCHLGDIKGISSLVECVVKNKTNQYIFLLDTESEI